MTMKIEAVIINSNQVLDVFTRQVSRKLVNKLLDPMLKLKIRQFFINFLRRICSSALALLALYRVCAVGVAQKMILVDVKHLNVNFATLCMVNSGRYHRCPTEVPLSAASLTCRKSISKPVDQET